VSDSVLSLSIQEFGDRLAGKQPTPGGGSVAALSGALGAGLISMVCQYTVGRERYASVEEQMTRILSRSEELRGVLEAAVDGDVAAYGGYAQAQKLPRETDDERSARDAALQAALVDSTRVPLGVAEAAAELIPLAREAAQLGNQYLISDAAVGAQLALAAVESALLNVRMNVGGVEDAALAAELRGQLDAIGSPADLRPLVEETTAIVEERAAG
jgi:formiminotetrahydrofolate cyclodeaminase